MRTFNCVLATVVALTLPVGGRSRFCEAATINVVPPESIQAAMDRAVPGDVIVVAPGEYPEPIDFKGKPITVRSSVGPEVTVINGTAYRDSVVKCMAGEGPDSVLDGFTIKGGAGNTTLPMDPPPAEPIALGGGMLIFRSSPTVRRCVFRENGVTTAPPTVGAGIFIFESNPRIADCVFIQNQALSGGGIYNLRSTPCVVRCRFLSNNAVSNDGGAVVNGDGSHAHFASCWFEDNRAGSDGGAMRNFEDRNSRGGSNPTLINCVFWRNHADRHGGALVNEESDPTIANCTFVENTANGAGGALELSFQTAGKPTVRNCILWANSPSQIDDGAGTAVVENCLVQGGYSGSGNIDADPWFSDSAGGSFSLLPGSPCIDAGSNAGVPQDTCDIDANGDVTELAPVDRNGSPRFVDDPGTPDTGVGSPPIVDIGACEFPMPRFRIEFDADTNTVHIILVHSEGLTGGTVCLRLDRTVATLCTLRPGADLPASQKLFANSRVLDANGQPIPDGYLLSWINDPQGTVCLAPGEHEVLVLAPRPARPGPDPGCADVQFLPGCRAAIEAPFLTNSVTSCDAISLAAETEGTAVCLQEVMLFVRGDSNSDGILDLSDAIFKLRYLFAEGRLPVCEDAADTNDDGAIDISDAVHLLFCLFAGTPCPPPPYPACGLDSTPDALTCLASTGTCSGTPCDEVAVEP